MAPHMTKETMRIKFRGDLLFRVRTDAGFVPAEKLVVRLKALPECEGVDKTVISAWENGRVRPGLGYAIGLESIFGIPVRQWFEVDGEPLPEVSPIAATATDPTWEQKKATALALAEAGLGQLAPLPPKTDPIASMRRRDEFPQPRRSAEADASSAEYSRSIVPIGGHTKPRE